MGREVSKAARQNLPSVIWQASYAELEPLIKALRFKTQPHPASSSSSSSKQQQHPPPPPPAFKAVVREKLCAAIESMTAEYVGRVKRAVPPQQQQQQQQQKLYLGERVAVLHACFVALGDLHRYRATTAAAAISSSTSVLELMAAAERYYWQALTLDGDGGKTWNQVKKKRSDVFDSHTHTMQRGCCFKIESS
jgi:hypothetical protein